MSHGAAGYASAKHGVVGLMRHYANGLGEKNIRVNTVNPTGVSTPMIMNEQFAAFAAAHRSFGQAMRNLLPVPVVWSSLLTSARLMIYLCAESGRYIHGITLSADAGLVVK